MPQHHIELSHMRVDEKGIVAPNGYDYSAYDRTYRRAREHLIILYNQKTNERVAELPPKPKKSS